MTNDEYRANCPPTREIAESIWRATGCEEAFLECLEFRGAEPALPGTFRVGTAASAAAGLAGLAGAAAWEIGGGDRQHVSVDMRHASASFRSERYLRVAGKPTSLWNPISGHYRTADERWIMLHTTYPEHLQAALRVLACDASKDGVTKAVAAWRADALEEAIMDASGCAAVLRTSAEWNAHEQSRASRRPPLVEITRIADGPRRAVHAGHRPLDKVRVLDLTRLIAGPVCGRVLAGHGAEVLRIGAAHLSLVEPLAIDTGVGKRFANLDLRQPAEARQLWSLIDTADVFVQAFRPGSLERRGFGPEAVASARPGIVYVSISAWGHEGAWRRRRGFDSIVQTASGIVWEETAAANAEEPRPLPAQALDHGTGHLAAFGAIVALTRRAREGGSYLVRVSLARTGDWLVRLGRISQDTRLKGQNGGTWHDVTDLLQRYDTELGRVDVVRPPALLSATPSRWDRPPPRPGQDAPAWACVESSQRR